MRIKTGEAFGELTSLPGCSQIVVSHGVYLPPNKRGKGLGDKAHKLRLEKIKELGYDVAICTVEDTNTPQINILSKNNWTYLTNFISSKTGHGIRLYAKRIQ